MHPGAGRFQVQEKQAGKWVDKGPVHATRAAAAEWAKESQLGVVEKDWRMVETNNPGERRQPR